MASWSIIFITAWGITRQYSQYRKDPYKIDCTSMFRPTRDRRRMDGQSAILLFTCLYFERYHASSSKLFPMGGPERADCFAVFQPRVVGDDSFWRAVSFSVELPQQLHFSFRLVLLHRGRALPRREDPFVAFFISYGSYQGCVVGVA